MKFRGTAPPTTLSTNSNPGAFRERLHLDVAHRVLAVAAGLLDVAAMAFRFAADGFPQRHPQLDGVHGDAVPIGQCVEHDAGVGFAHAPQHDLMRLLILLDAQCRVLGGQPTQPDRQLVLIGLGMRLNSDRQQRLRHRPGFQHQRFGLVGERVAGFGPAQLADRADVACHHGCRGALLLAEREGQDSDAFVFVVVGVRSCRSRSDSPKNDAKWPDT